MLDDKKPFEPTFTLAKNKSKYTLQRNKKIDYENKNLLEKMLRIEKHNTPLNPYE